MVRPSTPWLINELARGPPNFKREREREGEKREKADVHPKKEKRIRETEKHGQKREGETGKQGEKGGRAREK